MPYDYRIAEASAPADFTVIVNAYAADGYRVVPALSGSGGSRYAALMEKEITPDPAPVLPDEEARDVIGIAPTTEEVPADSGSTDSTPTTADNTADAASDAAGTDNATTTDTTTEEQQTP